MTRKSIRTGLLLVLGMAVIASLTIAAGQGWRYWGWWRFMKPETKTGRSETRGVVIECNLQVDQGSLTIEATVKNTTDHEVHLFDYGKGSPQIGLTYLDTATALHIITGVPPLPEFPTAWFFHPEATKLGRGESKSLRVVLQLPDEEWSMYYGPTDPFKGPVSFGAPLEVHRVIYEVDLVHATDPEFKPDPPRGTLDRVSCAVDLVQPVPVRPRSDPGFETQRSGRNKYPFKVTR